MTIKNILQQITQNLIPVYKDTEQAQAYAWWFLEWVTGKTQAQLVLDNHFVLDSNQKEKLSQALDKHVNKHMPLQYIFGFVPFLDLKITIRPQILIPRPETEYWCYWLIKKLKELPEKKITILDLCTGSGCIALALAHALPYSHVYAVDISEQACDLAKENAHQNNITNITIIQSDLYLSLPKCLKVDLIVSNPPYVSYEEWLECEKSVKEWEDVNALVAQDEGLAIIKDIVFQAKNWLKYNDNFYKQAIPQIIMEIGCNQGQKVANLVTQAGYANTYIHKDLSQKDRFVTAGLLRS